MHMKVNFTIQMCSISGYATNCHSPLGNNLVQIHKSYKILWSYIKIVQWSDLEYTYVFTFIWSEKGI